MFPGYFSRVAGIVSSAEEEARVIQPQGFRHPQPHTGSSAGGADRVEAHIVLIGDNDSAVFGGEVYPVEW